MANSPPLDSSAHLVRLFSRRTASALFISTFGRAAFTGRLGVRGLTGGLGVRPPRPTS